MHHSPTYARFSSDIGPPHPASDVLYRLLDKESCMVFLYPCFIFIGSILNYASLLTSSNIVPIHRGP
jgi:hypothetical protein